MYIFQPPCDIQNASDKKRKSLECMFNRKSNVSFQAYSTMTKAIEVFTEGKQRTNAEATPDLVSHLVFTFYTNQGQQRLPWKYRATFTLAFTEIRNARNGFQTHFCICVCIKDKSDTREYPTQT